MYHMISLPHNFSRSLSLLDIITTIPWALWEFVYAELSWSHVTAFWSGWGLDFESLQQPGSLLFFFLFFFKTFRCRLASIFGIIVLCMDYLQAWAVEHMASHLNRLVWDFDQILTLKVLQIHSNVITALKCAYGCKIFACNNIHFLLLNYSKDLLHNTFLK